ncbi:hypothetical protein ABMA28_010670 [Loxostege sticticalis]|uniref:Uncharacterized protein n=1 Tax=Loxostege sticticalis TaxID=481309 RepID=A0ABD0S911_LOXSC
MSERDGEMTPPRRLITPDLREELQRRTLGRPSRSRSRLESRSRRSRSRSPVRDNVGDRSSWRCRERERRQYLCESEIELRRSPGRDSSRRSPGRNTPRRSPGRDSSRRSPGRNTPRRSPGRDENRQPRCDEEPGIWRCNSESRHHQQREGKGYNYCNTTPEATRPLSPMFSSRDVASLVNSLKPQPATVNTPLGTNLANHRNILPDFDPSTRNQRIDIWLKKVNECATVYGWDERTTTHFAMQKLQGLAKVWYESQNTILFSWTEWQHKLTSAFPWEKNYGQSLEEMLCRKSRYNEPLEVYYYEKLALLNQCDIVGKRAVDCLIYGLTDKMIRSSASALRCNQPDQLLQFLMTNHENHQTVDQTKNRNRVGLEQTNSYKKNMSQKLSNRASGTLQLSCYNCKEKGHPHYKCPKPIIRCAKCKRMGHKIDDCYLNSDSKTDAIPKTMRISTSGSNSKFIKDANVNGASLKCFVDFGSEVTLIARSTIESLGLEWDNSSSPLKGFGNEVVYSLGKVVIDLSLDGVNAKVTCHAVEDSLLDVPLLVGHDRGTSFTSHAFKRFCLDKGINHVLNAVASPRSNGQVERYNRTILDSLTAQNLNGDEKDWDDRVGTIQWGLNNTLNGDEDEESDVSENNNDVSEDNDCTE